MPLSYTLEFTQLTAQQKCPTPLKQIAWTKVLFSVFKNLNQASDTCPLVTSLMFLVHTCELVPWLSRLSMGLGYRTGRNPGGLTDCQVLKDHKEYYMDKKKISTTKYSFELIMKLFKIGLWAAYWNVIKIYYFLKWLTNLAYF